MYQKGHMLMHIPSNYATSQEQTLGQPHSQPSMAIRHIKMEGV